MTEVFRDSGAIVELGADWLTRLKEAAMRSPLGRSRVCVHADDAAQVQEMIIALRDDVLFRPHRHLGKTESFHMIEGVIDIVIFDDAGAPVRTVALAEPSRGGSFYYRLNEPMYHTVVPRTPMVVFHETTSGPFVRTDTDYAQWAPEEPEQLRAFLQDARAITAAAERA
ncbi:WbuC family cupin fold metalloprotein [Rhodopseudomonas sp. B29]|uniref:WbuC family cupin fold metalloprotein n=1 Tax=Rhodopseudomonas sp. B29 TaxID=95607 RepID=UPI00034BC9A4|nr:WbuC family cupin fold metalloprotein [Rhodopseudomonas sp. B29]